VLSPNQEEFANGFKEIIKEGIEKLTLMRLSKASQLERYVKVLEDWDDKVSDVWSKQDAALNFMGRDNRVQLHERKINEVFQDAFNGVDRYLSTFHKFLMV